MRYLPPFSRENNEKIVCTPPRGKEIGAVRLRQSNAHPRLHFKKYFSIQSVALSAAVWPEFKCQIMAHRFDPVTPFEGSGWTYGGSDRKWYQSKSRPHIPVPLLYTTWAHLALFSHNNTQRGRQTDRWAQDIVGSPEIS